MQLDEEEQLTLYGIIRKEIHRAIPNGDGFLDCLDCLDDAADAVTDAVIAFFKEANG